MWVFILERRREELVASSNAWYCISTIELFQNWVQTQLLSIFFTQTHKFTTGRGSCNMKWYQNKFRYLKTISKQWPIRHIPDNIYTVYKQMCKTTKFMVYTGLSNNSLQFVELELRIPLWSCSRASVRQIRVSLLSIIYYQLQFNFEQQCHKLNIHVA